MRATVEYPSGNTYTSEIKDAEVLVEMSDSGGTLYLKVHGSLKESCKLSMLKEDAKILAYKLLLAIACEEKEAG